MQPNLAVPVSFTETTEGPFVDKATLDDLNIMLGGEDDPSFLQGLLADYFEDAQQLLAQARAALDSRDAPELKQAVHTLKSSSAMFGAKRYADVCQIIESIASTGTTDGVAEHVAWLEQCYTNVEAELKALAS